MEQGQQNGEGSLPLQWVWLLGKHMMLWVGGGMWGGGVLGGARCVRGAWEEPVKQHGTGGVVGEYSREVAGGGGAVESMQEADDCCLHSAHRGAANPVMVV